MTPVRYKGRLYARITRPCSRGTIGVLGSTRTHARTPEERHGHGGVEWPQVASGKWRRVASGEGQVAGRSVRLVSSGIRYSTVCTECGKSFASGPAGRYATVTAIRPAGGA
jgi:hypothetical protein